MTTSQFVYSLVLLILGQVPLVIKLLLDHRSKIDPYRKELFDRQVAAFSELHVALTNLHWRLFVPVQAYDKSEEEKKLWSQFDEFLSRDYSAWHDARRRTEFLLPAEVVKATWDYHVNAVRIMAAAFDPKMSGLSIQEMGRIWDAQDKLYNSIVNDMRIRLGVDALSKELLKLVERETKQLIVQELDAGLLKSERPIKLRGEESL